MAAPSLTSEQSRRAVLTATVGGLAVVAAQALVRPLDARAGHGEADDADALHLERNNAAGGPTILESSSDSGTLILRNSNGANALEAESTGQVIVARLLGGSDNHTVQVEHDGHGAGAALFATGFNAGVEGESHGEGPGAWGKGEEGPGVLGESAGGVGVQGVSGLGDAWGQGYQPGVQGNSGSGPGVQGVSDSGPGLVGFSQSGPGVTAFGEGAGAAVSSMSGPGVEATSETGPGVVGRTPEGIAGVVGIGSLARGEGTVPEKGPGVLGIAPGTAPAVRCVSGGLLQPQEEHPFEPDPDGGLALDVVGKARFSTAGSGTVAQGGTSGTVLDTAVTSHSHVTVALTSNPGSRDIRWIERNPGVGFTVHLSPSPPNQRPATSFTYLIVEPGA